MALPLRECSLACYKKVQDGTINQSQFEQIMKAWARKNYFPALGRYELFDDVKEIFGEVVEVPAV